MGRSPRLVVPIAQVHGEQSGRDRERVGDAVADRRQQGHRAERDARDRQASNQRETG